MKAIFSQKASTASTKPGGRQRIEPLAADQVHVSLALAAIFLRQRVQSQVSGPDRDRQFTLEDARHFEHAPLGLEIEAVAGLHLEGGDALGHQALDSHRRSGNQRFGVGDSGSVDRCLNSAAAARYVLVGCAAETLLEFLDAIAAVHEVCVAVDQARRHPQAPAILDRDASGRRQTLGLGSGADPGDTVALHGQRGAF